MNEEITRVHAREVLDSRGTPTVEVEVECADRSLGRAIVPSGASTGRHEAVELRDGDIARFGGKGVLRAVRNVVVEIGSKVVGRPASDQAGIDQTMIELDGMPNKSRLGANAILGVSLATAHAAAAARRIPLWAYLNVNRRAALPLPMVNLISGGLHAGGNMDIQDFLFVPIGARSYSEALQMTVAVYWSLGTVLTREGLEGVLVGDEGGYGPKLVNHDRAMDVILASFSACGLTAGKDAAIAVDVASTQFFRNGRYHLREEGSGSLSADDMTNRLGKWVSSYPVVSIEDGLAEDDWSGWKTLTDQLGNRVQLIGDDLFVTRPDRLKRGITAGIANAVLVKLNQVGTLTETLEVLRIAHEAGYRTVVSARSGETEDSSIADLAVGTGAGQIKIGSVARSERLAKYNQLLRIEEAMGPGAKFAGWKPVR